MKITRKLSNKKLRRVLVPGMALFLALVLTLSAGMLLNAATLDDFFGRGERIVTLLASDDWDTEYYPQLYANARESRAAAIEVSKRLSDEGIVLLKNNGLLPLAGTAEVSPLGLRYYRPFYGGSGSSAIDAGEEYIVTPQEGLHKVFSSVNAAAEETLAPLLEDGQALADNLSVTAAIPLRGEGSTKDAILEFSPEAYKDLAGSCAGTVGLVFLGRQTGEDRDSYSGVYDDGTPHMLALSTAEREVISFAKANCEGVVVVLESSSPMQIAELEDDAGIDAILWVGGAGCSGYESLGDILVGAVVPSGRTPDTYPADFKKDPTFANHDDGSERFVYTNAYTTLVSNYSWEENANAAFHEYEEGVYLGYKYYETSYDIGYLKDYFNRTDGVLYPFGYGLSYTSFSQEIIALRDRGGEVAVTVRVTNTGSRFTGKDVVQLYFTAPYTQLDQDYGIEKPTAVLLQFGKTGLLAPGESEDVKLAFQREAMASYCSARDNSDGTFGCYVLEEGEYTLSIRANSHEELDAEAVSVPATVWYDSTTPRRSETDAQSELSSGGTPLGSPAGSADGEEAYQAATNRFAQLRSYMSDPAVSSVTVLSRKDWAGTQPTAPTDGDRAASETVVRWIAESDSTKYDYTADPRLGNEPGSLVYQADSPSTGAKNSMVLADLRGKSYYDSTWNLLLDELTFTDLEELRLCLFEAAYHTGAMTSIGKPESVEHDGPQGLTQPDQAGHNWLVGTCAYPSAPVMAAGWNRDLLYELGYMVGQEALIANINGWYAPGLNLHRSPFGGRVSEYFSEDSLLAGCLGAQAVSGAGDAGLYCSVKHLVLIDSEGHRNPHTAVWLTEQALREVYLRPFEIALKTAMKTIRYTDTETGAAKLKTMRAGDFIMTGDCAVGTYWTSTCYELLNEVVRGEWGFQGFIVSDINLNANPNRVDMLLRSGSDALMSTTYGERVIVRDTTSATSISLLRRAVKNMCYTLVNSNVMQGVPPGSLVHYTAAPWQVGLTIFDVISGLILVSMSAWLVLRELDERKYPQHYRDD